MPWLGLPLWAVLVGLCVFRLAVILGGLPLIVSGLFCMRFARVLFALGRLCPAGGGRSERHPRRGIYAAAINSGELFKYPLKNKSVFYPYYLSFLSEPKFSRRKDDEDNTVVYRRSRRIRR